MDVFLAQWDWPVSEGFGFEGVHTDRVFRDDDTKEVCLGYFELALFDLEEKVVLDTPLEETSKAVAMSGDGGVVKVVVVHVDLEPSFSVKVGEQVIHEVLEHRGGVTQYKEHHSWFE